MLPLAPISFNIERIDVNGKLTGFSAQLLDFLPLRVNAMSQQHERIAERVLAWTLRAVEHNDYQPGIEAIGRSFKARA